MRIQLLTVAAATAWLGWTGVGQAGLANSVWPKFQHDARNTGRTTVNGPSGPDVHIAWEFRADSGFRTAVSVAEDGTIIAGNGKKKLVSGIDPDTGMIAWSTDFAPVLGRGKAGLNERSQPAVTDDGLVYVGTRFNNLWSIDLGGDANWYYHVEHDGDVTTSPTVASDGTVFMGSEALGAGWFFAMNPDGTVKWFVVLRGSLKNVSPALSQDESVVYVSIKREAIALDSATGVEIWRRDIAINGFGSRRPNYSPVVADDGTVYFQSQAGLWALDPADGSERWLFVPPDGEEIKSAPALGPDGTVYFGAAKKKTRTFFALHPVDGSVRWLHRHSEKGDYSNSQAAVGADGTVYVAFGRSLYAFDGAGDGLGGSLVRWQLLVRGKLESGPIIGGDGVLYLGAGKRLYKVTDRPSS